MNRQNSVAARTNRAVTRRNPLGPSQFENPHHNTAPTHRAEGVACTNETCTHGHLNCDNTHSRYLAWLAKGKP